MNEHMDTALEMLDHEVEVEVGSDIAEAKQLAEDFSLPFDPLDEFHVDGELFRTIPVDVMLRYHFLPQALEGGVLKVVMADPTNVVDVNEIEMLLAMPLDVVVGPLSRIADILEKSESTQRVLDQATEGFQLQLVQDSEDGEEVLSIDSITADQSQHFRGDQTVIDDRIGLLH